jgi:hypothetical protein
MIGSSRVTGSHRSPARRVRRKRRQVIFMLFFFLVIIPLATAAWAFLIEPGLLSVTRYTVWFDNLPQSWDGRTIAFFTDAHLGAAFMPDRLARVADTMMKEQPDLILFGGDLVDSRTPHDQKFAEDVSSVLARMQAPFGQYAVAGNHDNRLIAEYRYMKTMLEDGGFVLLDNQSAIVDGLLIGGLAESYFGRPELEKAFSPEGLISSDQEMPDDLSGFFRLLLMHQPDYAASLPDGSADLAFSGHSHNGQITFFGKPVITVFEGSRYPYGLYQLAETRSLIVSRGLGTVGIPARLGARPELVMVTVRRR